jgi:hypothetical protein
MNNNFRHIIHFIAILLLQVLVIDQINFGSLNTYINPIIIGTSLLIVPVGWTSNRLLIFAFIIGLIIDTFHNTLGINTSALLTLAFFKPLALRTVSPREGFESFIEPTVITLGIVKFLIYASILFFIYHLVYFSLESIDLSNLITIILKALASSIAALSLSILYQYLTLKRK